MAFTKKKRADFFDENNPNVFNTGDFPTEGTMQELTASCPFFLESSDKGTTGQQGLIRLVSDSDAKNSTNPDTTWSYGAQPSQLPSSTQVSQSFRTVLNEPLVEITVNPAVLTRNDFQFSLNQDFLDVIDNDLTTAVDTANNAQADATTALNTANNAQADATTALNTANNAQSTADQAIIDAANAQSTADQALAASGGFIGEMRPYLGAVSPDPDNWFLADGSAISRTTYAELFTLIGTTYGSGDGATTFNLPDLGGRILAGTDDIDPDYALGTVFDNGKTFTLAASNLPVSPPWTLNDPGHTHGLDPSRFISSDDPADGIGALSQEPGDAVRINQQQTDGISLNTTGTTLNNNVGGGQSVDKRDPYVAVNYLIKVL